jgi:hypothetical protein
MIEKLVKPMKWWPPLPVSSGPGPDGESSGGIPSLLSNDGERYFLQTMLTMEKTFESIKGRNSDVFRDRRLYYYLPIKGRN